MNSLTSDESKLQNSQTCAKTLVLYKRTTKSNNAHSAYKAQRTTKLKRRTQQIEAIMPKGARAQCVTTARAGRTIHIHNHTTTPRCIPNSNHKAYITITIPIRVLIYQSLTVFECREYDVQILIPIGLHVPLLTHNILVVNTMGCWNAACTWISLQHVHPACLVYCDNDSLHNSLGSCSVTSQGAKAIADGLRTNTSLKILK